jgi:hypothetical protein
MGDSANRPTVLIFKQPLKRLELLIVGNGFKPFPTLLFPPKLYLRKNNMGSSANRHTVLIFKQPLKAGAFDCGERFETVPYFLIYFI